MTRKVPELREVLKTHVETKPEFVRRELPIEHLRGFHLDGRQLDGKALRRTLAQERHVLLLNSGQRLDLAFFDVLKPDTLVLVVRPPAPPVPARPVREAPPAAPVPAPAPADGINSAA